MSVVESVVKYGEETHQSMRKIADRLHIDHTLISKARHGKYKFPEYMDSTLASLNWRVALEVIDERSGGYISNILDLDPSIDLSPAGLKERLQKDLQEALSSLGSVYTFQPEPDRKALEKAWHEITDVIEVATVARGVYEETYHLNHRELVKIHNQQRKEHKR